MNANTTTATTATTTTNTQVRYRHARQATTLRAFVAEAVARLAPDLPDARRAEVEALAFDAARRAYEARPLDTIPTPFTVAKMVGVEAVRKALGVRR